MAQVISKTGQKNNRFGTWTNELGYKTGDTVVYEGAIYAANNDIPPGTSFIEGTVGATWTQIVEGGGTASEIGAGTPGNVAVDANGIVTISAAGTANVVTVNANGASVLGNITTTGGITTNTVTANGNITSNATVSANSLVGNSLTITGNTNLGNVANLTILGGANGQFLQTDGNGNLTWANAGTSNGNSGITTNTSNVTTVVGGNTIQVVDANGTTTTGNANVTGNITATQTITGNTIVSNVANIVTLNVTGDANLGDAANLTILGGNAGEVLTTDGTGNVYWATGSSSNGNSGITTNTSNVTMVVGGNTIQVVDANGTTTTGNANVTGNTNVTGNVTAGNITSNGTVTTETLVSNTTIIANGNITSNGTVSGNTIQSNTANITGNVIAGNITSNGTVTTETLYSNTTIMANGNIMSNGAVIGNILQGNTANIAGNVTAGNVLSNGAILANGNITSNGTVTANAFSGNAAGLSNITGANVVGNVPSAILANFANFAGNVTVAAQPNITSVGTLAGLSIGGDIIPDADEVYDLGNSTHKFRDLWLSGATLRLGNSSLSSANGNIVMSSIVANSINTANLTATGITTLNTVTANLFIGNGSALSNINGANVIGTVPVSNFANFAGNLTVNAQPNITSVGTLTGLTVNGVSTLGPNANVKITGGANGQLLATDGTGNLIWTTISTSGASNGTSGTQVNAGNVTTVVGGNVIEVIDASGTTITGNANVSGSITANGTVTGNTVVANTFTGGNIAGNGAGLTNITGANVVGNVPSAVLANFANFAGNITVADQPNITSVGALTGLSVAGDIIPTADEVYDLGNATNKFRDLWLSGSTIRMGNANLSANGNSIVMSSINANTVTTANLTVTANSNLNGVTANIVTANSVTANSFIGNGSGLANITGANVTGTVANANYAAYAGNVTINAQANITSVGTLTSLTVAGNSTLGSNANVRITGGSNGQALFTDGAGNLNWTTITSNTIFNGNSNVSVPAAGGNVNISAAGNANVVVVTGNGINLNRATTLSNGLTIAGGGASITGDLGLNGNLNVIGNVNYNNVAQLVIGDPLIFIASNNSTDVVDSGLVSTYNTNKYTGVVRNHVTSTWTVFDNLNTIPVSTVDWANAPLGKFTAGNTTVTGLTANGNVTLGNVANVHIAGGTSGQLLSTDGTGTLSWVSVSGGANFIANGVSNLQFTGSGGNLIGAVDGTANSFFLSPTVFAAKSLSVLLGAGNASTMTPGVDYRIAVGYQAGDSSQATNTVAIGNAAGKSSQAANTVAIGASAGQTSQLFGAVAIGSGAGRLNQGSNTVAVGILAGSSSQGNNAVAIGAGAGATSQHANTIVLNATGSNLETTAANSLYVAPVRNATASNAVYYDPTTKEMTYGLLPAIDATKISNGTSEFKITGANGNIEGTIDGNNVMRIESGYTGTGKLTIGQNAESSDIRATVVGHFSGASWATVVLGGSAGNTQSRSAVHVGYGSGIRNNGGNSVTVGANAGTNTTNGGMVIIGSENGRANPGANSISIGNHAVANNSGNNSIVLNASGTALTAAANSFYVNPVRNATAANVVFYDPTTKEVTYGISPATVPSAIANGTSGVSIPVANGSVITSVGGVPTFTVDIASAVLNGTLNVNSTLTAVALNVAGAANVGRINTSGNIIQTGSGMAIFRDAGNVIITGGSPGQFLQTNGSGNLTWTTISSVANANFANFAGNVTVAAQPNITSVGTLTSVTVSGVANLGAVGNVKITGGSTSQVLSTDGAGNLSWVSVSAAASANFANFAGNVTVAAQPNITSVGTLTSVTVSGVSNLGNVGNVRITGGSNGQYLRTDGTGNLTFVAAPVSNQIALGNSYLAIDNPGGNIIGDVLGAQSLKIQGIGGQLAFGFLAGQSGQGSETIAMGSSAGRTSQGNSAIALGHNAGTTSQGANAIAIGYNTANANQGSNAIAIGAVTSQSQQGEYSIVIGANVANATGTGAITIGANNRGSVGVNSIAIGQAAANGRAQGTIILSASGSLINAGSTPNALFIDPIRNDLSNTANVVCYNPTTKEVTYGPAPTTGTATSIANGTSSLGFSGVDGSILGVVSSTNMLTLTPGGEVFLGPLANGGTDTISMGVFAGDPNVSYGVIIGSGAASFAAGANMIAIGSGAASAADGIGIIAIGADSAQTSGNYSISLGHKASGSSQRANAIAIGHLAALNVQGFNAIAIGANATAGAQRNNTIVLNATGLQVTTGAESAFYVDPLRVNTTSNVVYYNTTTKEMTYGAVGAVTSIANGTSNIGFSGANGNILFTRAGNTAGIISGDTVALGFDAAWFGQSQGAVAVGHNAGRSSQGGFGVAVGQGAASISQKTGAVAIGRYSGENSQGVSAIAIGYQTASGSQGNYAIALGENAAMNSQGIAAIAIGQDAGRTAQKAGGIAIGYQAGNSQQVNSVAIGYQAGNLTQNNAAVAIGPRAGSNNQSDFAVAIGSDAGNTAQGTRSVAIGYFTGNNTQGANSIAIGPFAGFTGQGANSIAIGSGAGNSSQAVNSIILNASGSNLTASTANAFYVKPVRNVTTSNVMYYEPTSGEISYGVATAATPTSIVNGTSNVVVDANAAVRIGSGGIANVVSVNINGVAIKGVLSVQTGASSLGPVNESFTNITGATGVVTHNCAGNQIFNHSSIAANFTVNLTSLTIAISQATVITLILNQGVTAYVPNALQIAGVAQTIRWQGTSVPSGNAGKLDAVAFTILCTASSTYVVTGQLVSYG